MIMKEYFPREQYLNKVSPFIDKPIIKVIIGQRRVGKSMFLFQLMDHIKQKQKQANIIYINTEEEDFQHITDYKGLQKEINSKLKKGKKNYVFIDEIQDIQQFERALRNFQAKQTCDIYCTGSNSKMMAGELATFLSGRYIELQIHPLSFTEFCMFHNLSVTQDALLKYFRFGGMPFLRHLPLDDEPVYEYLRNIYNTILLHDVAARYSVRNLHLLNVLFRFLSDNVGGIFSATSISTHFKKFTLQYPPKSILEYLAYMQNAMIINEVSRYNLPGKRILTSGTKIYYEDIGIRNAVVGGFKPMDIHKILENVVYSHLIRQDYKVYVGQHRQKEIDFIAEKNSKKVYIQVAYKIIEQATIDREFGNLLAIKDNFPKLVVSMDDLAGHTHEGIEHVHVFDFLQQTL
jgi:predicted AAA+ superfamily ATPase